MANVPKKTLAGVVGGCYGSPSCFYGLRLEGEVLVVRHDPIGIVTACYGDTKDVCVGQRFTPRNVACLEQSSSIMQSRC